MLQQIVKIINSSSYHFDDGTLYCDDVTAADIECIAYFKENNFLENNLNQQNPTKLELTLAKLNSIGYYENIAAFILKNKYKLPQKSYYIDCIKCFDTEENDFISKYQVVISLINSIKNIAKHTYIDVDIVFSIIFQEDKALLMSFDYDSNDIQQIEMSNINILKDFIKALDEKNEDKKQQLIYINELIDFVINQNENDRFKYLLSHMNDFSKKVKSAYQYYIKNFSYNELKIKLNNSTLEHSKKIQSVINEAQTKLIAIPTALVLAVANIDFSNIMDSKNIGIITSLFMFAFLIELFIRNQKSALAFIKHNIEVDRNTLFDETNEVVQKSFKIVDEEWENQNARINIIRLITWITPILLLVASIIFLLIQKPIIIDTIINCWSQVCQK